MDKKYVSGIGIAVFVLVGFGMWAYPFFIEDGQWKNGDTSNEETETTTASDIRDNKWSWHYIQYSNDTRIEAVQPERFILTFEDDGRFSATTDCNNVSGEYRLDGEQGIRFGRMVSTLMFCEGSDEAIFVNTLNLIDSYSITSEGNLLLRLRYDSGVMTFYKAE